LTVQSSNYRNLPQNSNRRIRSEAIQFIEKADQNLTDIVYSTTNLLQKISVVRTGLIEIAIDLTLRSVYCVD